MALVKLCQVSCLIFSLKDLSTAKQKKKSSKNNYQYVFIGTNVVNMAKFPASEMLGYRQPTEAVTRVVVVSRSETQNKNNSLPTGYWVIFHSFFKISFFFFEKFFQKYKMSAWSGSKLFAKVISNETSRQRVRQIHSCKWNVLTCVWQPVCRLSDKSFLFLNANICCGHSKELSQRWFLWVPRTYI